MPSSTFAIKWDVHAHIDKYDADQVAYVKNKLALPDEPKGFHLAQFVTPVDFTESEGNLLTRLGLQRIGDRLIGTSSNQALDSTHTRIGVGDGTTAAATTDTDLSASAGSTHRQFIVVDSAPTRGSGASSGVYTFVATHTTGVSNFHWQEWGIDGGTANGTTVTTDGNTTPGLFNRKVTDLGTKTSAASWVFTVTCTLS